MNVIDSHLGVSPVVESYTRYGEVCIPSLESTVDLMRSIASDIDSQSSIFLNQVPQVVSEYDWESLTSDCIGGLVERVGVGHFNNYNGYLKS